MIGSKIGHYAIRDQIGSGGMGTVYRAHDPKLERDIALKVLKPEMAADPDRRSRFLLEAKAVAALQHPNIVTVHSVDETDGTLYLTMELVEGHTLDAVIPGGGMALQDLLRTSIALTDAVAYAHSKGITHRDLKPTNIMVDDRRRVRVLDFGLAKLLEAPLTGDAATIAVDRDATAEGKIIGTAAYMSPEQAEGKAIDHRTDIFSLGVVLFEMATGRRPFQGDTHISTISSVLKDTPKSVTEFNQRLPRHLARIINRCLEKDPERRYQTAADLRIDLEGLKEETESGVDLEAVPTPTRNRPTWLIPVAIGFVGTLVVWAVFGSRAKNEGSATDVPAVVETAAPVAAQKRTMLVVLPFKNLGPPEDAYFADGITEEITSHLASVNGLGVISSTSANRFANSEKSLREIGQDLGVEYIIEGSVRWQKSDDGTGRVRVTPQLVRVADDTQLWSERYDESVEAIFDVQSRIAQGVVQELSRALGNSSDGPLLLAEQSAPTRDLLAYQLYLQAQRLLGVIPPQPDSMLALLHQAVERDPGFVDAWGRISLAHSYRAHFEMDVSEERLALAREAAEKALSLDPANPAGRIALGYYFYWGRKDYRRAIEEFEATGMADSDTEVMNAIAFASRRSGDFDRALNLLERSAQLDPKNPQTWDELGGTYVLVRRPQEALAAYQRAVLESELDPTRVYLTGLSRMQITGDPDDLRRAIDSIQDDSIMRTAMEGAYAAATENYGEALRRLSELPIPVFQSDDFYTPVNLIKMGCLVSLGRREEAQTLGQTVIADLEEAVAEAPKDWRRRVAYAHALALTQQPEAAVREARLATELIPVSTDALNGRVAQHEFGLVLILSGREEEGAQILRRLLEDPYGRTTANSLRLDTWLKPHQDHPAIRDLLEPTP